MDIAKLLVDSDAIKFGNFVLSSGATSNYYVDIKMATAKNPALLGVIASMITSRHVFDVVAGVAVGGIPLAVAVSMFVQKPYAIIRKEKREHGNTTPVIGDVFGFNVLLVEDVTTTGNSAMYGIEALRDAGATATRVITVVDREQGAETLLYPKGVELYSLVRINDILKKRPGSM